MSEQLDMLSGVRDGATFTSKDLDRLNAQARRVFLFVMDQDWHSLREIADYTGDPEASVSARLRDLRKPRFGGMGVERNRLDSGLWMYRLTHFGTFGD